MAATQLPVKSVGIKQLKNGAVTASKVKGDSLTGEGINAATLGSVPNAVSADTAAKAEEASLLQGRHASDVLAAGATAANSSQIGDEGASAFLGAPVTVRTKNVAGGVQGT